MIGPSSCRLVRRALFGAAATAASFLVAGCSGAAADGATPAASQLPAARPAATFVAESVTVRSTLDLPTQLHVERDVVVAARTSGVLESVLVDLGAAVAAGAVLATVESDEQRLAVERAEAVHEEANRAAVRARALTRVGGVTAAESASVESAARTAAVALREAKRALGLTTITAPFAGVVSARYVAPHRLVRAGDTLFRLTERSPLLARIRVPEADAARLVAGSPVQVTGLDGASAAGRLLRIAPVVDPASGTREVVLSVAASPSLRPGSAVSIRLEGAPRRTLMVPRASISDGHVLVVDGPRPTLRAVTVGATVEGDRVEVTAGLAAGERVRRPDR